MGVCIRKIQARATGRASLWTLRVLTACAALALAAPSTTRAAAPAAEDEPATLMIQEVRITGNQRVEEEAIRIHIGLREGAPLDRKGVDGDVRALYEMGFFDDVSAD